MIVAVANKQESLSSDPEQALILSRAQKKYYLASLNALSQGRVSSEEVVLLASALFIILAQLDDPEEQTADGIIHLMSAIRILNQRLELANPTPAPIIDDWLQPLFVRTEFIIAIFASPDGGTDAMCCRVEPQRPVLPHIFSNLTEARKAWVDICCWRYSENARTQPWTLDSPSYQDVRSLALQWYRLVMTYAGKAAMGSPNELRRTIAMISQFRILIVALIYSARHDLHPPDLNKPTFVNLITSGEVSLTYNLPKRALKMLPGFDWEQLPLSDPMGIRLWPVVEAVKLSEETGVLRLAFKM